MFDDINQFDDFIAFLIAAFDVKSIIEPLQCSTEDRSDLFWATSIGTFGIGLFLKPVLDAFGTVKFTTPFALIRFENNIGTYYAYKGLVIFTNEAIWVVPVITHFCWVD